jgi:hypothetical protein
MVSFPAHHIQYNLVLVFLFLSCNVCTYTYLIFMYSGMQKNYYSVHVLFSFVQVGLLILFLKGVIPCQISALAGMTILDFNKIMQAYRV